MSIFYHQDSSTTIPDTAGFSMHRRPAIMNVESEPNAGRKEVAFIDASLADVHILADHIREGVEIVMLDGPVEPIAHMAAWAAASAGYDAIHVVSHGDEGRVQLGGTVLDSDAIAARAAELAAIAGALGDSGQILLYGCNVGRGAAGAAFVDRLALATGVRVAASTTPTGPRALGGDWLLEAGSTAGIAPLFAEDWTAYGHLLPIPLVFNVAGGIFVRPGTASYTWTFGQGASPPNLTTYAAVTHISFGNADFPAPTADWIVTRGKFQYSSDGGGSWTDYAYPGFGTNYVPVAGTVWRFVDQMPADTTTTNNVSTSWQVAAYPGQGVTSGSTIIPDNAPTGIDTNKSVFFDDASQGETVATLTPVDTGLMRNGYWEIVGQSVPGLFTLTYDSSLGNTATLKIGAGAVPAVGATATVTARYYDTYQTDSAGNPINGEGYTKTFTLTSVDADSTDLNFGSDLKVSTTAAGSQAAPAIATLGNGNFVTVWQSAGQGGEAADKHGIYGQIHDSAGNAVGVEFAITAAGNGIDETAPTVTALDNGRFVVAYATASASDGIEIAYRIVAADGTVGTARIANTTATGDQSMPAIAALDDGSFVMAWGAGDGVVRGQKFDPTGAKSGPELVFSSGGSSFTNPAVAALDNGAYVVTWGDAATYNILASVSTDPSTILQVTNDGLASSWESGAPLPRVAGLQDGGFVIAWDSYAGDAVNWQQTDIFYRQYTSGGSPLNAMQQANTESATGTYKFEASVAALSEGGFVITWQADTGDHDQNGIFGRRFSSSGTALDNSEFEINQYRRGDQNSAVTTGLASDMFATVWVDETSDTSSPGIEGRVLLLANDRPTLTAMADLTGGAEDTRQAISFADLAGAGDEADTDGTVDAFVVKALGSGTLKIGTSAQTATAWAAGSNDRIDATHTAYWTPAADASGTLQAFTVVARDNNGAESSGAVPVRVDVAAVNDAPIIVELANDASDFEENTPQYIDDQVNSSVAAITDSDSADFDGGSLTIARTGGTGADNGSFTFDLADDAIKAGTTLNGADGTLSIGDTVYVNLDVVMSGSNWVAIGRIHGSDDGQGGHALRIDLEGSDATPEGVALFLQYLQYTAPTSGARVFSVTIDDGDGATSAPVTFTMNGIDTTAPQLDAAQHVPLDDATGVAVTVSPRVAFDENVQFGTGKITLVRVADGGVVEEFDVATDTGTGNGKVAISGAMLTINPTAQLDYGTAYAIRIDAMAIEDMAGNAFAGISGNTTYNFTTTLPAPTVAITSNKSTLKAGDTATITFTFSEAPTGFEAADVTVSGGSLGTPVADANNSLVYTATFTPAAGTQNLSAAISVGAGTFANAQGTANAASTTNVALTGDTLVPTVAIASTATHFKAGQTATITFTFSEVPSGFADGDVTVTGGTLGALAATADPKIYTATFTPAADMNTLSGAIAVAGATFTDTAGNQNTASTVNVDISGDTLRPTVTDAQIAIGGATGTAGAFRAGDTVTVTWNNTVTGDHNPDAGSVAVDFSQFGGGTAVAATNSAGTWSAAYTIAAGTLDATGRNVAVTVADLAGNSTTQGDSSNATVDNQAPVVTDAAVAIGGASGTNGIYRIGDTITATWNNTVTGDQNGDVAGVTFDFSQFGGGAVAAVNNAGTWSATYTLAAGNVSAAGRNVAVTVTDDAGNSTAKADSSNAQVDLVRALVGSIAVAGTPAANAAAIDFTVVFDEAVSGVDAADFALHTSGNATGTIAGISGSGTTYTVSVNGISGEGALRLDLRATGTGIADVAGNAMSTGYTAGGTHATSFNADPVITSNGGGATAIISLAERLAAVTTVAASDADQDALTYSIAGGADQARFDIDAVTGALRFKTAPTVAAATDSDGDSTYLVDVRVTDSRGASDTQALTINVLADLDGDGTADVADDDMDNDGRTNAAEDPVPGAHGGTGDGNGDGIADSRQINVASLPTAVAGNPFATLAVADGLTLTSVSATAAPGALPRNVKLPLGQFDFTIGNVTVGATVEMSIYVDAALKVNGYFKQDITGKWVSIAKSVTTVGTKTKITFDLTDGGPLDSDGIANGSITDPGGVALIAPLISSNGGDTVAAVRVLEMTRHVTTVSATAPNAVTYAISGGADMAKFAIDATTGVLSFIAAPDFESPQDLGGTPRDNTYEVQVSATSDGEVDTQTLNVTVADVNETHPVPPVVPPRTDTVDGVIVSTGTVTNSDGSVSQVVTIPVVVPERPEVVGNNTVADIPLVKAADGSSLLTAQVPVGYGITVTGTGTPKAAGDSLTDLIREIKAHTAAGSQDQNQLTGGGSGFLQALPSDKPLLVQTIVPTTASSTTAPAQALAISAAPQAANGPLTALVIDTRALPAGVEIQLQNVDFAAIVGAVHVTGGAGSQLVWGDGASQNIMLGADDDILHGGGGDDIVGSAGGNDQIFGDEGNDIVFGGLGNDTIDGGTGIDTVRLVGAGRADYTFRVAEGKLIVSHRDGGADGTDTVANVEKLQFTGAGADTSASGIIARMYDAMFDRAPDAAGLDYWVAMNASGMSLDAIAERFVASAETDTLLGAQGNAAFIDGLYQRALGRPVDAVGRDYWLALLEQGKVDKAGVMIAIANSTEKLAQEAATGHTLDVNLTDVATLVRMYDTLFDRKADAGGLNHWIAASESGVAMRDIAWSFVHDSEAASVFGAMSNRQFVEYLYATGLERQGSAAEVAAWAAQLDDGTIDRGDALLGFADSAEKMALVGVISTSIDTI